MGDILIEAKALCKAYHGSDVLHDISMTLKAGEIVTLIGPNGAGKSTLLQLMLGLEKPDSGTVTTREGLKVGYVPQSFSIQPSLPLRVLDFLTYYSDQRYEHNHYEAVAERLGIAGLLGHSVHTLSGGELRRLLLARALLNKPDLLILDEPLAGVDVGGQADLYQLIEQIVKEVGCGVLMVSHDLHVVMASTHHVVCLNHHICCEGRPHQLGDNKAFVELFGEETAAKLALYSHSHDHCHDIHGDVLEACDHEHH